MDLRLLPRHQSVRSSAHTQLCGPQIVHAHRIRDIAKALVASMVIACASPSVAHCKEGIKIESGVNASEQYFQTVPQGLDAGDDNGRGLEKTPKLSTYLQGKNGKEIQQCTRRCTATCIRGGQGAPGLGPMALRREVVVFKPGYRSGKYCLTECLQICALQINGKK